MQVSLESTSNLGRKLTVDVPPERIDPEVEKRLKAMSQRVKVAGFRPGKVPFRIVKQRFGDQVLKEVTGEVLRASFQEAVAEKELRPAGGPRIESGDSGEGRGLRYTATFEVYPEFALVGVENLEITRPQAEITEADVDETIEKLRAQRVTWEPIDRAAQKGDQVVIDFQGAIDGESFEGSQGNDLSFELGAGRMLSGFEDQLAGSKAGEDKKVTINFPADHHNKKVAGKTAEFDVKLKTVSEPKLPALDEDFARSFGIMEGSIEELRRTARANMDRELERKIDARTKMQVMDGLLQRNEVELPEIMVRDEVARLRKQAMQNLGETDAGRFTDELFTEEARKRVKLGLIVGEIVRRHEIKPDREKVQQNLQALAATYNDPQQVIDYYQRDRAAMMNIEAIVIEDQVVDWVLSQAKILPETTTFAALMNPPAHNH